MEPVIEEITAQDGQVYVEEDESAFISLGIYGEGLDTYAEVDLSLEQAAKVVKALQRAVLHRRVRRVGH